jgi:hypothetical protein
VNALSALFCLTFELTDIVNPAYENRGGPITCSSFNRNGAILAYGVSYDWSQGYQNNQPNQPNKVMLHACSVSRCFIFSRMLTLTMMGFKGRGSEEKGTQKVKRPEERGGMKGEGRRLSHRRTPWPLEHHCKLHCCIDLYVFLS